MTPICISALLVTHAGLATYFNQTTESEIMNAKFIAKTSVLPSFWLFCFSMFLNPSLIADEGNPIAIRWWGRNSISIETHWNFEIAINPLAENKSADLFVLTQSCTTDADKLSKNAFAYDLRGIATSAVFSTQVLDRLPNQDRASWSSLNSQANFCANSPLA